MCLMCLMCLSIACSNEAALACQMQACLIACLEPTSQGLAKGPLVKQNRHNQKQCQGKGRRAL